MDVSLTMQRCNELLSDPASMNEFFESEGYLFLQGVLDSDVVGTLSGRAEAELRRQNIIDTSGWWTGQALETFDEPAMHNAIGYDELWTANSTKELLDCVLGTESYVFKQTQLRVMVPGSDKYWTPPHQDSAYIGPTHEFRTCWVPLRDAPAEMGGLAISTRSHHEGLREHVVKGETESFTQGLKTAGVELAPGTENWISAEFHVGDVVIFHPYMVHVSAPNRSSDKVRVSMDTRFQPASAPRGYVATHDALTIREESRRQRDGGADSTILAR